MTNPTLANARKILKNHSKASPKMPLPAFTLNIAPHEMPLDLPSATRIIIGKLRYFVDKIEAMETRRKAAFKQKVWQFPDGQREKTSLMKFANHKITTYTTHLSRWVSKYSKLYTVQLKKEELDIPYLIQQAKRTPILRVLAMHGIEPNRFKKIKCINPQHSDSNPSMHLYENQSGSTDRLHCFTCGASYDAIEAEKVLSRDNFVTVIKRLAT